ncbi:NUDIX hydrolase [Aurantiacibacter sediminis]|uniref:NUDIX hydrolase n=1 Tax=Aurantiacibacter sediminis TaxID=2793064 RepID=A0ABS0N6I1_9SPHN|nr:NUDIX hydrolase [Aurantiacibacter sediminis]MBH5323439.1 NUDIX hydrolase [Aurantiacibacter sediminis]
MTTEQHKGARSQTVVEAATVLVFRQRARTRAPELLMVQRSGELAFAARAMVFPGGKLHASDRALAAQLAQSDRSDDLAHRLAGIREVLEETGLVIGVEQQLTAQQAQEARTMLATSEDLAPVLARFGWSLAPLQLVPFARWLPRGRVGRAFDTRFYLADLGSGQVELEPDLGEMTRLTWLTARDALARYASGEMHMIFPTLRNLERLAQFDSFAAAAEHARNTAISTISPWIEEVKGRKLLRIPEGAGYPVTSAPLEQSGFQSKDSSPSAGKDTPGSTRPAPA